MISNIHFILPYLFTCLLSSFGENEFDLEIPYVSENLTELWRLPPETGFRSPESIIYDQQNDRLFVSNFNVKGGFIAKGDYSPDEFVSALSLDGKILDIQWLSGLASPLGMILDESKQHLFVVEREHVAIVDASGMKGHIVKRIPLNGTSFPNDIALDDSGALYVSDSGNEVWRCSNPYSDEGFELWIAGDEVSRVNGLYFHQGELFLGCDDERGVVAVNVETKNMRTVAKPRIRPIDGIQHDSKSGFFVSWFKGRLAWVSAETDQKRLLINHPEGPGIADFVYIPEKELLVLPDLLNHHVQAFRYKEIPGE